MTQPKSVDQFNSMTNIQQVLWINYETGQHVAPSGILFYPMYDLAIYYERQGRKITGITAETFKQAKQRVILELLARRVNESSN